MTLQTLPKYETYKDSGIEWLGEIPAHWQIFPLKRALKGCTNGLWGGDPKGLCDIIVLRVADFDRQKLIVSDEKLTIRSIPIKDRENRLLKKGDLLIEKSGGGEKTLVGCVVYFDKEYEAITSNFVAKITPKSGFNSCFLNYAFSTLYSLRINYLSIKQTTGIQNLDTESYFKENFAFPSEIEQTAIAHFLDQKTAQIDAAIAIKEQQIALLKERKQILIQQAVTQGLDPTVPMKDSGVEWIGEIPAHWEMKKLKYIVNFYGGGTPSKENKAYWDGEICWVSPKDMKRAYISSSIDTITELAVKESSVKLIPKNSVLIVVRGMILVKKIPVAIAGKNLTINQDMKAMVVSDSSLPSFLMYLLDGLHEELSMLLEESGHGTKTLPSDKLGGFYLPVPLKKDQVKIVGFIEEKTVSFKSAIDLQQQQIEKLREYKTTLINSAVTGKIKVA